MASSNKHWPSMFRSNPAACDFHHQPDMSNTHTRPSLISSGLDQETTRSPGETKPRWNPRPEQIRILEGIFNSGVVNPPRDEIRRIRLRLQEYGHVADANVFYWFQNRKSRTKNKLRAAAAAAAQGQQLTGGRASLARASLAARTPAPAPVTPPRRFLAQSGTLQAPTSSSSSSSDRSSGSSRSVTMKTTAMASAAAASLSQPMLPLSTAAIDLFAPAQPLTPSPALSACQLYYQLQNHPMTSMPMPTPVGELVTSSPEPAPLLLQWPPQSQCQYLPATELGGFLGSHAHTHPTAVSPDGLLLSGLCTDSALGQHEIVADMSCSKLGLGGGGGQYCCYNVAAAPPSDAVSAVMKDDEKARLGLLHHYSPAIAAGADVSAAVLPCTPPSGNAAASSAFTDQLQGLLDAGLLTGGGAPAPVATVVAVAAGRPGAPVQCYSVPAMARMDVKALFGPAAVLLGQTGEAIPVDAAGVTVEPLQNGPCYYVLM